MISLKDVFIIHNEAINDLVAHLALEIKMH